MIIPQPNTNFLIKADCLQALKELPDNSIDSVVTDPPYGLSFMGKRWDYDVPKIDLWKAVFRVLKPGGFLLSFAGTRTYHRMAVNIEDAGFEIRDMISWLYGSGFPKSYNIGKAVDKLQGNDRIPTGEIKHHAQKGVAIAEERGAIGGGAFGQAKDEEVTKGNSEWEGWGTGLKPSNEPIVVARKPLNEKNVALNVLKWGTGGINIDDCRIEKREGDRTEYGVNGIERKNNNNVYGKQAGIINFSGTQGRFPANIILDEEAGKILDEQSGISSSKEQIMGRGFDDSEVFGTGDLNYKSKRGHNDKGGASRFFYCAKASKGERNYGCEEFDEKLRSGNNKIMGDPSGFKTGSGNERNGLNKNNHPTVKPIKLMQYLVRLVTKKGGICLDPFLGSGTTAIACIKEGMNYIGIEREEDYIKIAEARIKKIESEMDNTLDNYTESNGEANNG